MNKNKLIKITRLTIAVLACLLFWSLSGCEPSKKDNDPDEDKRYEALSVYIAWNGAGGETMSYDFSGEGVIKEGDPPERPEEDGTTFFEDELPGGRTFWFRGVSKGDATATFTIKNDAEETVYIYEYVFRVHDDLSLTLLREDQNDLRN